LQTGPTKREMNMNSSKDKMAVVNDAPYVILGGGGNTGSIIANSQPISFEEFVQDVFAPAYHGKALTA
jgi:hypothetical protein